MCGLAMFSISQIRGVVVENLSVQGNSYFQKMLGFIHGSVAITLKSNNNFYKYVFLRVLTLLIAEYYMCSKP